MHPWIINVYAVVAMSCSCTTSTAFIVVPPSNVPSTTSVPTIDRLMLSTTVESITPFKSPLQNGVSSWLVAAVETSQPPSDQDIALLRQAFAAFYSERDDTSLNEAESLLTQVIERWQGQPDDERAGIYRVRGDCYLALADANKAIDDYSKALALMRTSSGSKTIATTDVSDPVEFSAASLGRARAAKSLVVATKLKAGETKRVRELASQSVQDYETALMFLTRSNNNAYDDDDDDSTPQERIEEGVLRNPYVAWEWGDALRLSGRYTEAAKARSLTSFAFGSIGDKARSVMALTDAGIDYASAASVSNQASETAVQVLRDAIQRAPGIESRDINLLQRVIEKEGEGRMALAALLWTDKAPQRMEAERILGDACIRLDQLQGQTIEKQQQLKASSRGGTQPTAESTTPSPQRLRYTMDDDEHGVVGNMACYKFKNPQFLTEKLDWPEALQRKVIQLETLQ